MLDWDDLRFFTLWLGTVPFQQPQRSSTFRKRPLGGV